MSLLAKMRQAALAEVKKEQEEIVPEIKEFVPPKPKISLCCHAEYEYSIDYTGPSYWSEYTYDSGYLYINRYCSKCKRQCGFLDKDDCSDTESKQIHEFNWS